MEDPGHTQQRPGIGLGRVCAEHRGRIKGREHQLNPGASSGVVLSSTSLGAAARTESQVLMGLSVPLHDGELGTGVHTPVAITGQSRWPCGSSALGCLPEGNGQLAEVSIWQRSCCMMRPPRPGNTAPPSRPRWMQHEVAQGPHRYGWNHRVGFCAGVDAPQVYCGAGAGGLLLPDRKDSPEQCSVGHSRVIPRESKRALRNHFRYWPQTNYSGVRGPGLERGSQSSEPDEQKGCSPGYGGKGAGGAVMGKLGDLPA